MYDFRLWTDKDLLEVYGESESWFQMELDKEISKRGLDTRKIISNRIVVRDLLRKVSPSSNILICDEETLHYKGTNCNLQIPEILSKVSFIDSTLIQGKCYLVIVLEKE